MLLSPALRPKKLLLLPVTLKPPELVPTNVLSVPVVFCSPVLAPKKALLLALLLKPAARPKIELKLPVVLFLPGASSEKRIIVGRVIAACVKSKK